MPLTNVQVMTMMMDLGVAVPLAHPPLNPMRNYHAETKTQVTAHLATLNAILNQMGGVRQTQAKAVLDWINAAGPVGMNISNRIADLNFVVISLQLGLGVLTALNAPSPAPIRGVWGGLTPAQRAAVVDFASTKAANRVLRTLIDLINVAGTTPQLNLVALGNIAAAANVARPAQAQRYSGITPQSLADLRTLYGLHPPMAGFAGFAAWGVGNHGEVEKNITWHFLKHVCGVCLEDGEEPDANEHAEWWQALNIHLDFNQLQGFVQKVTHGTVEAYLESLRYMFYGPGNTLAPTYVAHFLQTVNLSDFPALLGYLMTTYRNAYRDYALNQSTHLEEAFVQSNGIDTYVTGCVGELFIIGRLAAGVLGISSCYFGHDIVKKMQGARSNKVWDLI